MESFLFLFSAHEEFIFFSSRGWRSLVGLLILFFFKPPIFSAIDIALSLLPPSIKKQSNNLQ